MKLLFDQGLPRSAARSPTRELLALDEVTWIEQSFHWEDVLRPRASVTALRASFSPHLSGKALAYNHCRPWTVRQGLIVLNMLMRAKKGKPTVISTAERLQRLTNNIREKQ